MKRTFTERRGFVDRERERETERERRKSGDENGTLLKHQPP